MKSNATIMAAVFILAFAAAGYAQSLAELAKKEKERRAKVEANTLVITNSEASKYKGGALTTSSLPSGSTSKSTSSQTIEETVSDSTQKGDDAEAVDFFGRTESFWRKTFRDVREKVRMLEDKANVLVLNISELQTKFYNEDNGFAQQQIQREIQKAIYEQDLTKDSLAKARAELQELEIEARKSGALPGWLRETNP